MAFKISAKRWILMHQWRLKKEISNREINHSTYLYYGSAENHFRPQFNQLINPETSPAWLIPISQSELPGSWVLYEVNYHNN